MPSRDQYLGAIHRLEQRAGGRVVRMSELVARLGARAPTATARVQKMAAAGPVGYGPGRGVTLTDEGRRQAAADRRLRLIERLLGEVLRLPGDVIGHEAESVAGYTSERVVESIDRYFAATPG